MKLLGQDNSFFELTILGYQFPELTGDEWDANWLKIQGHIALPIVNPTKPWKSEWSFIDPCLLTWEVQSLAEWFEACASRKLEKPEVFTEPNLEFHCPEHSTGKITIRVYFELEARPPWNSSHWDKNNFVHDLWIDLIVTPKELHEAATDLRKQLEQFPQRLK